MILIISNNNDQSTTDVLEWITHKKERVIVLNEDDFVHNIKLSLTDDGEFNVSLKTKKTNLIDFAKVNTIWYRRGKFEYKIESFNPDNEYYFNVLTEEWKVVNDMLLTVNGSVNYLGSFSKRTLNKLHVLKQAAALGLRIPETLITDQKKELIRFFKDKRVINKTIGEIISIQVKNQILKNRTIEIDINELQDEFYPSLFQELIEKKYELRIFFLRGKFYTSAIFSQSDSKSKIDYRNHNHEKPNRVVCYKLNAEIKNKLSALMNKLELDTGSIDMMVSTKGEFYFLEINPVGQFGMVSKPCNYYCEKEVSNILIN